MHISLHDVYNPGFWTDDIRGRNLTTHPSWMPNEEGLVVLDWLVYQLPSTFASPWQSIDSTEKRMRVCNLHTLAKARFPYLAQRFAKMREEVLGAEHAKTLNPLYPGLSVEDMGDPTIFWETGCKI
jgi:hypothetical protein